MAEPLLLGQYHDAVTGALEKIAWVRDADAYPEKNVPRFTGLATPAVYFSINGWEQGGGNEGQLNVNLSCDLFVVVDAAGAGVSRPEIFLRTAAADITQWIDGQQFGLTSLEPAVLSMRHVMSLIRVWMITWSGGSPSHSQPPLVRIRLHS